MSLDNNANTDAQYLNLQFLLLVRERVKTDRAGACVTYGLDEKMCDFFGSLNLQQMHEMAGNDLLLFSPRVPAKVLEHYEGISSRSERAEVIYLASGQK